MSSAGSHGRGFGGLSGLTENSVGASAGEIPEQQLGKKVSPEQALADSFSNFAPGLAIGPLCDRFIGSVTKLDDLREVVDTSGFLIGYAIVRNGVAVGTLIFSRAGDAVFPPNEAGSSKPNVSRGLTDWGLQNQAAAESQTAPPKRRRVVVLFGVVGALGVVVVLGLLLKRIPEATGIASTPGSNAPFFESSPSTTNVGPEAASSTASLDVLGDCRRITYSYMADGRETSGHVYSYVKGGVRHYTSKQPIADCIDARPNTSETGDDVGQRPVTAVDDRSVAPNGKPWPTSAGYIKGYPVRNSDGYSQITVDNTQNNSAVFVKLAALNGTSASPVRQFYIPAGSQFTAEDVSAGRYDVRYMNLSSGNLSRSEAFTVEERETNDGIEYSTFTLTLYKVHGGNMHAYPLDSSEF